MKNYFPFIVRDSAITRNGNFYVKNKESGWFKMELYLPCATGTYGKSLENTANQFFDEIESGKRPFKYAITDSGNYNHKDYSKDVQKWLLTGN
ncbi:hypothetical protein PYR66_10010 [Klebsiella aerogenes]|nr:hypothetical protein PYR66_10010 [Klebsiella aerogenes]